MVKISRIIFILFSTATILFPVNLQADTSEEKTRRRYALLANPEDFTARIELGIIIAEDVADCMNMDFAAEAESALRMLDDDIIDSLIDEELKSKALNAKYILYKKLLIPDSAYKYQNAEITAPAKRRCFGRDIEMPYYADFGLKYEGEDSILMPFVGIGLTKSAFSSMFSANPGVKFFSEGFSLNIKWVQAVTPDFSCFDYRYLESYFQGSAGCSFNGNVLRFITSAGRRLYSYDAENCFALESTVFTATGFDEELSLELMLFNNGLDKISAEISGGLKQIPDKEIISYWTSLSVPFSFDLVYLEFGFLPRFFHSGGNGIVNTGKKHFIYENAIILGKKSADSLFYRWYETSAAIDTVFRLFAFPLPAPADRIYLGLNGSFGFGYDSYTALIDFLYYGGLSAGFDLNDNTPFEIRFGIDQNGYLFTYMTVVNRISHSF